MYIRGTGWLWTPFETMKTLWKNLFYGNILTLYIRGVSLKVWRLDELVRLIDDHRFSNEDSRRSSLWWGIAFRGCGHTEVPSWLIFRAFIDEALWARDANLKKTASHGLLSRLQETIQRSNIEPIPLEECQFPVEMGGFFARVLESWETSRSIYNSTDTVAS